MINKLKYTAVLDYANNVDGTGLIPVLVYTTDKRVAEEIVRHETYYSEFGLDETKGDPKSDTAEREITIVDSLDDFLEFRGVLAEETEKRIALAKLTEKEKKLLKLIK